MTQQKSVSVRTGAEPRSGLPAVERRYAVPQADIFETPDAYVLMLDMPGAVREQMSVRLDKGTLLVKAPVEPLHASGANVLHREHTAAGFERAFALGDDIDPEKVDAQFDNGVLTVRLLKAEEVKPREISIQ